MHFITICDAHLYIIITIYICICVYTMAVPCNHIIAWINNNNNNNQDSFYPAGISIWNALPQQLVDADSLEAFKTGISTYSSP